MYRTCCFYGAVVRNDFEAGNIHYEGLYKGWALTSRLFWAPKWQRAQRVPFQGPLNLADPLCRYGKFGIAKADKEALPQDEHTGPKIYK
jgi:hypothetical protein